MADDQPEGQRAVMELEFVQCLANPAYLTCSPRSGPGWS